MFILKEVIISSLEDVELFKFCNLVIDDYYVIHMIKRGIDTSALIIKKYRLRHSCILSMGGAKMSKTVDFVIVYCNQPN